MDETDAVNKRVHRKSRGVSHKATFYHENRSITPSLSTRAQHRDTSPPVSRMKVPKIMLRVKHRAVAWSFSCRAYLGALRGTWARCVRMNQ